MFPNLTRGAPSGSSSPHRHTVGRTANRGRIRSEMVMLSAAPLPQYPNRLFTMFFSGSPFSNLPYWFRKKRIA